MITRSRSEFQLEMGLTLFQRQLQTEAEFLLRKSGIPIGKTIEAAQVVLIITVTGAELVSKTHRQGAGAYYYFVGCEIVQAVRLERDQSISVLATTWEEHVESGFVPVNGSIRDKVATAVTTGAKAFINAYLEANPK